MMSSRCGTPNIPSSARSSSRCPPCAAGSMRIAPSSSHIRLPHHRSPWTRAGASSSSNSPSSSFSINRSNTASSDGAYVPGRRASSATAGAMRSWAQNSPNVARGVSFIVRGSSSGPNQPSRSHPSGAAPNPGAPASCVRASASPKARALLDDGCPAAILRSTSFPRPTSRTSTTRAPPSASGSFSQRRPAASSAKKPAGAPGRALTWVASAAFAAGRSHPDSERLANMPPA